MKRFLKIIILILTICITISVFSSCSILASGNNKSDGDTNSENNGDVGNNDNGEDNNNSTVNGLPEIKLTEGMSIDEIKMALKECSNYKMSMSINTGDQYDFYNYKSTENCIYLETYEGPNADDTKLVAVNYRFYNDVYEYDLIYYSGDFSGEIATKWKYQYDVTILDDETKELYNFISMWGYLLDDYQEDPDNFGELEVKDGKLIIFDGRVAYTFYDFNKTQVDYEHYFPDYKSLEVGNYEGTIGGEYVKGLVQ